MQAHVVTNTGIVQLPMFIKWRPLAYWVVTFPAPYHSACIHVLPSVGVLQNQSGNFLIHLCMYIACLVYSLQPVKQRPEQFFASGHKCFLPRTFQFINYKHPSPIYTLATVFLTHRNQQHMPNVIRSRPVFNPLVLNNAYAVSQEVRFKFLHDTAYAAAQYGHSCTSLLGVFSLPLQTSVIQFCPKN
jgi:hypothetical protein